MKNKGISLIVLIITIVVIIILATAIIVNIANTNLIGNAKASVFKSDISNMKDELTMYITDKYTDTLGKYEPQKLQATEEGIWYGSEQQEGTITDIITSMDEKYVGKLFIQDGKLVANKMLVTVEEEKWLNDVGINSAYKTDIGKIEIVPSTTEWINGNVEIIINYTKEMPEGYVIEYKINNEEWQQGTQITVEENNTKVTARLYSKEKDNEALSNSYTVANIDKVAPDITNMKIDITAGTNSITAVASGATDTLSGIAGYQYSIDNSSWTSTVASGTSYTFSGILSATSYTVYARTVDNVGNVSSNKSDTVITQTAVAKVGTTNYASVTAAINSISTSGTVTLLTSSSEKITIASGKNITLNLAGYTLSSDGNTITNLGTITPYGGTVSSTGGSAIYNNSNASLKITSDVTISNTTTKPAIYNYGTTNISAGTISSTAYYAIDNQSGATLTISGGTVTCSDDSSTIRTYGNVTISGGNITNTNSFWALKVESGGIANISGTANFTTDGDGLLNYGTINFSGGTVTAKTIGVYNPNDNSNLTVSGGIIKSTAGNPIVNYGTATLSGGTITNNGTSYYAVTTNTNGVTYHKGTSVTGSFKAAANYTVNSSPVCTCYYGTLNNAVASTESAYIYLMMNLTESVTIASGKNITLNLSGRTLTSATHTINNAGTLTVDGSGTISSTQGAALYNTGTANITSGTLSTSTYYTIYSTGTLNVSGGTITNSGNSSCVDISGTLKMTGGVIQSTVGYWALKLESGSTATLNGGTIGSYNENSNGTYGALLHYGSSLYVSGATIHADYGVGVWINSTSSSATLNSGIIEASNYRAVINKGTFMYTGGTISSPTNYYTIYNDGGYVSGDGATIIGGGIKN